MLESTSATFPGFRLISYWKRLPSSTFVSMPSSSRLYHCCRCYAQVIVCTHCDRGQRYCTDGCSQEARKESIKRARAKYQATRPGRMNNAARQQRYRERQQQKVTHHRSLAIILRDLLQTVPDEIKRADMPGKTDATVRCHHCGAVCGPFLRSDFLQSSQFRRRFRRH